MIRKIVVPQERKYVLELPEEFVGKQIEVLAFELDGKMAPLLKKSAEDLEKELVGLTFHAPDFKFDRDEANNYE